MIAAPTPSSMILDEDTITDWEDEADVVVVGYGMGGACAAIEAREAGADVLILEIASGSGGTSGIATGHFYLGGGTAVQKACGFEDSADDMFAYLMAASSDPSPEKLRLYADGSVAHFDWLERQGIPFERSYFPEKAVAQPGTDCLIWTGNEKVGPFRDRVRPAPRGHKVAVADPASGGGKAMQVLTARADALGVRALYDMRVDALVRAADGRIVGVRAVSSGRVFHIRARGGVVLASGGFGQNEAMLAEYIPSLLAPGVTLIAGPHDTGVGIRLGMAAGAATQHMGGAFLSTYFYPPQQLVKGIVVNADGDRFVAEDSYHARTAGHILAQPDARAWLIVDAELFAWPLYAKSLGIELVDGWDTIAEMEQALAIAKGRLADTISVYNAGAARGEDGQGFGKHPDWLRPLGDGPYAAFDLSFGRAGYRGFTLGGLRVSIDGEVETEQGSVIPGLYAAGTCASNLGQEGIAYASGTCLGQASFFGRRAGRHAATSLE